MPDEKVDGGPAQDPAAKAGGPEPDFNSESFRASMRDAVAQYMATEGKDNDYGQDPQPYVQPQYIQPDPNQAAIRQVLDPIYGNEIKIARLEAASARDQNLFYTQHPEAVRHMRDIETMHLARLQQGIPDTRETLWNYYKGLNQEKFFEEQAAREKMKINQANMLADMGGGFRPNAQSKDPHEMSDEDLKKSLENVVF